jgi:hypothetical protein
MFLAEFTKFVNKKKDEERKLNLKRGIVATGLVGAAAYPSIQIGNIYRKNYKDVKNQYDYINKSLQDYKKQNQKDSIRDSVRKYLGLDPDKTYDPKEVKQIYRKNARKYHPDTGGSDDAFKAFETSYQSMKEGRYTGAKLGGLDQQRIKTTEDQLSGLKNIMNKTKNRRNLMYGIAATTVGVPALLAANHWRKNKKKKDNNAKFSLYTQIQNKRTEQDRKNAKLTTGLGTLGTLGVLAHQYPKLSLINHAMDLNDLNYKNSSKSGFMGSVSDYNHKTNKSKLKLAKGMKIADTIQLGVLPATLAGAGLVAWYKNRKRKDKTK